MTNLPWAYAAFMLLATVAFALVMWFQPKDPTWKRLAFWDKCLLLGAAFIGGSLGGKLPFVLTSSQWWTLNAWFMDGKTITTGLVGAYLAVEFAKRVLGVRAKTGDRYAMPLAAGLAVGRIGCFFNGCCFGVPTSVSWGVYFAIPQTQCHPAQLYESLFHATMFVVLLGVFAKRWCPGHRLQGYLLAYCLYRFVSEWWRPEPEVVPGLTIYQLIVALFATGLVLQWALEYYGESDSETPAPSGGEPSLSAASPIDNADRST